MKQLVALLAFFSLTAMTSGDVGREIHLKDSTFLKKAMQGGYSEVFLASQVLRRAKDPGVRHFAQTMIRDHTRNDAQIARLARSMHVSVKRGPDLQAEQESTALHNLHQVRRLEYQYLTYEVNDHESDLTLFQREDQETKNPRLRKFVEATIPILKRHLALAQNTLNNRY